MRDDERFVATALANHLHVDPHTAVEDGEDPPDFYISTQGTRHAVEVTQLSPISVDKHGRVKNRHSEDEFALSLCDALNASEGPQVPADYSILLHLRVPVDNPRRFKKAVRKALATMLTQGSMQPRIELLLEGHKVSLTWMERKDKAVVGMVENTDARPHILENASRILCERIRTKNEICAALGHRPRGWR